MYPLEADSFMCSVKIKYGETSDKGHSEREQTSNKEQAENTLYTHSIENHL